MFVSYDELNKRAGCFTSIMFLLSSDCLSSVTFPRGDMGQSVVWDCGISWFYLLVFV